MATAKRIREAASYLCYGLKWAATQDPVAREIDMIKRNGRWKTKYGQMVGNGLSFHFKAAIKLLWPHIVWHSWLELIIDNYLTHRSVAVMGPASTGKTCSAALCVLLDYYAHPTETTVIVCSTTKERLEDRIWGELKSFHKKAQDEHCWLPGHLIESKLRLITQPRDEALQGRDFRQGIVGVACKPGGAYQGLGEFAGLKAKRMRLLGDELGLLPRVFVDAISNLDKNPDFKVIGLGNPKETTDALGILAEPAAKLGGWDGGIDQAPKTKVWETRRPDGVCIQLVGSDSPNLDGKLVIPLITQEQIDRDVAFYGRDSLWFTMMDQGMMPRGQGSRRVLTRQVCQKFGAFNPPNWLDSRRTKIGFLDAAYGGAGGDRCVFGTLAFGPETPSDLPGAVAGALINQRDVAERAHIILALTSIEIVPLNMKLDVLVTDQIVNFVKAACERENIPPSNFFYDSGMRSALVSAFGRLWSNQLNAVDCGGKPSERRVSGDLDVICRDYYSKYITEIWFTVRLVVESGQFRGMTDDVCYEFSAREWTMVAGNKIEVEPKEKMKEKIGRSPDVADAVAIGVLGAVQRGFVIRRAKEAEWAKKDEAWKAKLRQQATALWRGKELSPQH